MKFKNKSIYFLLIVFFTIFFNFQVVLAEQTINMKTNDNRITQTKYIEIDKPQTVKWEVKISINPNVVQYESAVFYIRDSAGNNMIYRSTNKTGSTSYNGYVELEPDTYKIYLQSHCGWSPFSLHYSSNSATVTLYDEPTVRPHKPSSQYRELPKFTWEYSDPQNFSQKNIEITIKDVNDQVVFNCIENNYSNSAINLSPGLPAGEYFWNIKAYNSKIWSDYNDNKWQEFIYDTIPPEVSNIKTEQMGDTVKMTWNCSDSLTGVEKYYVVCLESGLSPENGEEIYIKSATFDNLSSNKTYYGWIKAFDEVGNESEWIKSEAISLKPPSSKVLINKARSSIIDGEASYSIELQLEDKDTASYVIKRSLSGTDNWIQVDEVSYEEMSANDFIYTDDNNLQSHGRYRYKVYTKNEIGDKSKEELSDEVEIPNIKAALNLPDTDSLTTNEKQLEFTLPDQDIEGDSIKYRVLYKLKEGTEQFVSSETVQQHDVRVEFPSDGEWQWWLEVEESNSDMNFITGPAYETEKRMISIDTKKPQGSFKITDDDGEEYTNDNPTKRQNINIKITDISDEGVIDSGIKELIIYNSSTRPDKLYNLDNSLDNEGELKENIAAEIESGTAAIKLLDITDIPVIIPWVLTDNDGIKTVIMEINDKAGNVNDEVRECVLDTTPPAKAINFTHEHSNKDGSDIITFNWENEVEDVSSFKIDGVETESTANQEGIIISGSYVKNVDELGYNQPVEIAVISEDKAGNQSKEAGYTAYTKAQPGEITDISGGFKYNEDDSGYHYLEFTFDSPPAGRASYHVLESGVYQNGEFSKDENGEIELTAGKFIDSSLQPHGVKDYRLAAYNESGDAVYGSIKENVQVPNTPPTAPEINKDSFPQGWTVNINRENENRVEFKYQPAADVDGDNIRHIVLWVEGNYLDSTPQKWNEIDQLNPESSNNQHLVINPDDPDQHGKVYTWFVEARENEDNYHEVSRSEKVLFTVDLNSPEAKIEDSSLYRNESEITVSASDIMDNGNPDEIYSDIQSIKYNLIYPDGTTTEEAILTDLRADNNAWSVQIPLEEGEYILQVSAQDKAGNSSAAVNQELKVDYTVPQINSCDLDMVNESGLYKTYEDSVTLNIEMKDPLSNEYASGIRRLKYCFVENQSEELEKETKSINIDNNTNRYQLELDTSDLTDGHRYYLFIQAEDRAGNQTDKFYFDDKILIDRSAPEAVLDISGLNPYGEKNYLASLKSLTVNTSAVDEESGISSSGFNIYSINNDEYLNSEWQDFDSIVDSPLTDGEDYCIAFRAVNNVGNTTVTKSKSFVYDGSAPTNLKLDVPAGKFVSRETLNLTARAEDSHSPIKTYQLAVGSTPGGTDLSTLITANEGGYLEMEFINSEYRLTLPEVEDGIYYTTLVVTNAAGKKSSYRGDEIEIDNTQEKLIIIDEGPYTASNKELSAEWLYSGEKEIEEYNYRLKIKDGSYLSEEKTTVENKITEAGLELEQGRTYQFEVRAVFTDKTTLQARSKGVTVDTTAPVINSFTSPEYSISDKIQFDWDGEDAESGILKVEVALGTDYNQTDVTGGWVELINNTLNYDSNGQALDLKTGEHYYPILRITNGAGSQSDMTGNSIIIDDTPPPPPVVDDHAQYINLNQPIILDWTMTELENRLDPESGNTKYLWAYSKNKADLSLKNNNLKWNDAGNELKIRLEDITQVVDGEIKNGTAYYFAVKTVNGAGLESIGITDGLIVDRDAPSIPELRVLSTINLNEENFEELNYLNSLENVKLWIKSYDLESKVNKYRYVSELEDQIDSIDEKQWLEYNIEDEDEYNQPQVIALNNIDFEEGKIYQFAGESYNGANLVSQRGYSSGIILDITAPKIINVNGTVSGNNLIFDWDYDPESSDSPVVRYETALVTDPTDIPEEWVNNGLSKRITIDASSLSDGKYYLKVRAFNAAGNHSRSGEQYDEIGISPEVILDRIAPEVTEFVQEDHPGYVNEILELIIKSKDNKNGSGISSYQYALGSYVDPTLYSGEWLEVVNPSDHAEIEDLIRVNQDTSDIKTGKEIYLRARVKDNVNRWSDIKRSGKLIVDHTPPAVDKISISGPETVNTGDKIKNLNLVYEDAEKESEITHYRISAAEEKGGEWEVVPPNKAIAEYNQMVSGLELAEKDYYLVVELYNSVGLSTVKYSEKPVSIDITSPVLSFVNTDEELVFNNPTAENPGEVVYTLSEIADVTFTLTKPGGSKIEFKLQEELSADNEHIFKFKESTYGSYILTPTVVDKAGNSMEVDVSKKIRVNEPPRITFSEDDQGIAFYTTKGKVITLKTASASDADGTIDSYQWETGEDPVVTLTGKAPEYSYSEYGDYTLTLTVSDNDGGISTVSTGVKVENTKQGQLYMDETWQGTHHIYDDILVPAGIKLTVLPGTKVIVDGIPGETGYNHILEVEGELEIRGVKDNNIVFSSIKNRRNSWQGLKIDGRADINAVVINDAFRGLTLAKEGRADIKHSTFENNNVGLHCCGSSPEVSDCKFINNLLYGIKEDNGGRPLVIDSVFTDNGIDYYHQKLNWITINELNSIEDNTGNAGQ